jgi:putative sigma-54 modulation protein
MQTSVTFKNLDPSDTLRAYVSDKLDRLDKYLYNPAEANVVLAVEKFRHIAEIKIVGDRMSINGKEETNDMYSAIDMVLDKMEKQIKKTKEKTRERRPGSPLKTQGSMAEDTASAEDETVRDIYIKSIDYKPMDIDEAIMQMKLVKDNFLVFTNARTDDINVLYRRKDGHFGLIQPRA